MGFMKRDVWNGIGLQVDTDNGTYYVPACDAFEDKQLRELSRDVTTADDDTEATLEALARPYVVGEINGVEIVSGFFGRYSAPGYMDCTDWLYDADEAALLAELDEMYADDEDYDASVDRCSACDAIIPDDSESFDLCDDCLAEARSAEASDNA